MKPHQILMIAFVFGCATVNPVVAQPQYFVVHLDDEDVGGAQALNDNGDVGGDISAGAVIFSKGGKMIIGPINLNIFGINITDDVVGGIGNATGTGHAFLYHAGSLQDLGLLPGALSSAAYGINNAGQIVGWSGSHWFLYSGGTMMDMGIGQALKINNLGQIVGTAALGPYSGRGAFFYDGSIHFVEPLPLGGNEGNLGYGINDAGDLVGASYFGDGISSHPFLYHAGSLTDLGNLPGTNQCEAIDINIERQVVGNCVNNQKPDGLHAFLFSAGNLYDLASLIFPYPGLLDRVSAINRDGIIAATLHGHPILLKPIGKPESHILPLSGSQTSLTFTVQWIGTDVGPGIQDYTIYVSDNGGPFTPWLTNTTATQATYSGAEGHTYGFYSIARDLAGNVENPKSVADASTVIPSSSLSLWANTTMGLGQTARLPVSISAPAPTGGVIVTLVSSDASEVTVTPSVVIPAGRTGPNVQPMLTGLNLGSATITASATGYLSTSEQATVRGSISFGVCCVAVYGIITQNVVLNLSGPAPVGGLTINLTSEDPGVATVPATVTFPANATSLSVPITAVTGGTAVIDAGALPNLAEVSIKVTVVGP
jgi:probable HAF family extracellular repeat protein